MQGGAAEGVGAADVDPGVTLTSQQLLYPPQVARLSSLQQLLLTGLALLHTEGGVTQRSQIGHTEVTLVHTEHGVRGNTGFRGHKA